MHIQFRNFKPTSEEKAQIRVKVRQTLGHGPSDLNVWGYLDKTDICFRGAFRLNGVSSRFYVCGEAETLEDLVEKLIGALSEEFWLWQRQRRKDPAPTDFFLPESTLLDRDQESCNPEQCPLYAEIGIWRESDEEISRSKVKS